MVEADILERMASPGIEGGCIFKMGPVSVRQRLYSIYKFQVEQKKRIRQLISYIILPITKRLVLEYKIICLKGFQNISQPSSIRDTASFGNFLILNSLITFI